MRECPRYPLATVFLLFLNLLLFYLWSGSLLAAPPAAVALRYSLTLSNPLSYLTYTFVQLWPLHLFANLVFLLVFCTVVEPRLGHKRFFLFYFGGAALAGLFAAAADMALGTYLPIAGASGAVFVLLGAAVAFKPLRTIVAYLFLSLLVVPVILAIPIQEGQSFFKEQAVREVERIESEKELTDAAYAKGELSNETYAERTSALAEEVKLPAQQVVVIKEAQRREAQTPSAETIHITGSVIGVLLAFRICPGLEGEWRLRAERIRRKLKRFL